MELPKRIFVGEEVRRLYRDLLAAEVAAGGAVNYAAPVGLTVGGSNVEGISADAARSDHKHALPAFGTTAGTFAEGNDSRFSSGADVWDARVVPSGLHADSDEFTVDTIGSGAWLDWDPNAYMAGTVETADGRRCMKMVATGNAAGNLKWSGKYKAIPAAVAGTATFTVLCEVAVDLDDLVVSTGMAVGIGLLEDATGAPTTCNLLPSTFIFRNSGATVPQGAVHRALYTDYAAAGTSAVFREYTGNTSVWLRCRVTVQVGTSTLVGSDWSSDGINWSPIGADLLANTYGALHVGPVFGVFPVSRGTARIRHWRIFDGVNGYYDSINGGYI